MRVSEALFQYGKTVQSVSGCGRRSSVSSAGGAAPTALQVDAPAGKSNRAGALRMGYVSYFDVIQADRDLFVAELALAQAYANNMSALVHLYSALGGGWQEQPAG